MSLNVKQCDVTPIICNMQKISKEFMTTEEENINNNDKNGGTIANTNEDGPKSEFQIMLKN